MTERINMIVGDKRHRALKAMAARRGWTITKMIETAIKAWEEMEKKEKIDAVKS